MSSHSETCKCIFCRTPTEESDLSALQIGKADRDFFNTINSELQDIAGNQIAYYSLVKAEMQPNFSTLYREARGRAYYQPVLMKAHIQQEPPSMELSKYGIDSTRSASAQINIEKLIAEITDISGSRNMQPKLGDLILCYHFPNNLYEIKDIFAGDGTAYQSLTYKIFMDRYQRSVSDIVLIDRDNQPVELVTQVTEDKDNTDILP